MTRPSSNPTASNPSTGPSTRPSTRPSPYPSAGPRVWNAYVAIGDSFTEGMSDPDPNLANSYVGWADRLAITLSDHAAAKGQSFAYANLAVRGRLLADVVGRQLDRALELEPDLVSMVGGGNDILRPRADLDSLAARVEAAVVRIRATGADVLLATPVDPADAPLVRHTRARAAVHSANLFSIASRHGAFIIDQWGMRALRDWRLWADDRIHLRAEGHRRVAEEAAHALGLVPSDPQWRTPMNPAPPVPRREAASANAQWAREYVGPWVQRRLRGRSSGDLLDAKRPTLQPVDPSPSARD